MKDMLFFHIGCTLNREINLQAILDEGIRICVIDEVGLKSKKLNLLYYSVFGYSYQKILETIKQIALENNITMMNCHLFTLAEGSVDLLNRLLKDLNKIPLSHYAGSIKDKYWVRKRLSEKGIDHLPYLWLATGPSEIPQAPRNVFPLIVKPVGSVLSRNVFKVNNNDELRRACLEIFTKNRSILATDHGEVVLEEVHGQKSHAIIETKLTGEKLSAEVIVHNGKMLFHVVNARFDYDNDFFFERAIILDPHRFSGEEQNKFEVWLSLIVDALEVRSAILNIEFFYEKKLCKLHLLEVNFRLCGARIPELIKHAYAIDLTLEHLKLLSKSDDGKDLSLVKQKIPEKVWITFGFTTCDYGIFEAKRHDVFGFPIDWCFQNGQEITKLPTARHYILGLTVFSVASDQVEIILNHLVSDAEQYFNLKRVVLLSKSHSEIKGYTKDALKLFRIGITVLYITTCLLGALSLLRNFEKDAQVMSEAIAKILSFHLDNGEVNYVASILNGFDTHRMYKELLIVDDKTQVIFSAFSNSGIAHLYREKVDSLPYYFTPISNGGIEIGKVLYVINYKKAFLEMLLYLFFFSMFVLAIYWSSAKYLFSKIVAAAKSEADDLGVILTYLKQDLQILHDPMAIFSTEKYADLLRLHNKNNHFLYELKHSINKFVDILLDLRKQFLEKGRLSDLLDDSTKHLLQANAQAEMAKVAHDIRKPFSQLQAILEHLNLYQNDPIALDQASKAVKKSIKHVESMVSDIMDFSREVQLETAPVALAGVLEFAIRQVLMSYAQAEKLPDIHFQYDLQHTKQPFMDDERMARVFVNIITNAIEAITVIGKKSTGTLWIQSRDVIQPNGLETNIEIIIGNDGPPFAEEDTSKLFSSFYTNGKKKGTGLGLASVEKILRLHSGKVSARNASLEKGGVEFVLELPASLAPESLSPAILSALPGNMQEILTFPEIQSKEDQTHTFLSQIAITKNVIKGLLLEDEALYRAAIRNRVANSEALQNKVILYDAHNVDEALALLAQDPDIRFAIVDIDLGEIKSGFDFLRAVKGHYPLLRSMVHTNRCIEEDKQLAKELGAIEFASKPMGLGTLAAFLAGEVLPQVPVDRPNPSPKGEATLEASKTVICHVADDSWLLRKGLSFQLSKVFKSRSIPFTIKTFSNPEELLDASKQECPDFVFCDFNFDETSLLKGVEVLPDIKALHPSAKLFLVSCLATDQGMQWVEELGLTGFFDPASSANKIAELMFLDEVGT